MSLDSTTLAFVFGVASSILGTAIVALFFRLRKYGVSMISATKVRRKWEWGRVIVKFSRPEAEFKLKEISNLLKILMTFTAFLIVIILYNALKSNFILGITFGAVDRELFSGVVQDAGIFDAITEHGRRLRQAFLGALPILLIFFVYAFSYWNIAYSSKRRAARRVVKSNRRQRLLMSENK